MKLVIGSRTSTTRSTFSEKVLGANGKEAGIIAKTVVNLMTVFAITLLLLEVVP